MESLLLSMLHNVIKKYIKSYDRNNSHISMWAGEIVFRNIELDVEAFKEAFPQFLFLFVNGHIQELHIKVPWTKLSTEAITITINSFELSLKLNDNSNNKNIESTTLSSKSVRRIKRHYIKVSEDVSSYNASLLCRVLWNVNLICNNVVLKYIEDDIVLSINIKSAQFHTANGEWEKAYVDTQNTGLILRKLISLIDLSVHLDQMDSNGKISSFEDPLLHRCSVSGRSYIAYETATSEHPYILRFDILCDKVELGLTDKQTPMLVRIVQLLMALYFGDLIFVPPTATSNLEKDVDKILSENEEDEEVCLTAAWSLLPTSNSSSNNEIKNKNVFVLDVFTVFHFALHLDNIYAVYKISETDSKSMKSIFRPLLGLNLEGFCLDSLGRHPDWANFQIGCGAGEIINVGDCSCSKQHSNDLTLFTAGQFGNNEMKYLDQSLFNPNSLENQPEKRDYSYSWEEHFQKHSEVKMLERSPFFSLDYFYHLTLPEDAFNCNLTYSNLKESNLKERSMLRLLIAPCKLNITENFVHRIGNFFFSAFQKKFKPYSTNKVIIQKEKKQLIPTDKLTSELKNFVPFKSYSLTIIKPTVWIFPTDNSHSDIKKKKSNLERNIQPVITIEVDRLEMQQLLPMYAGRMVQIAIYMPVLSEHFLYYSQSHLTGKIIRVKIGIAKTHFGHLDKKIDLIPSFTTSIYLKELLCPNMWENPLQTKIEFLLEIDNFVAHTTWPQVLLTFGILNSWSQPCIEKLMFTFTDLPEKAVSTSTAIPVIIFGLKNTQIKYSQNATVYSATASFSDCVVRLQYWNNVNNMVQVTTLLHGPENKESIHSTIFFNESMQTNNLNEASDKCFKVVIQIPINLKCVSVPPLFVVCIKGFSVYLEPALLNWIDYIPNIQSDVQFIDRRAALNKGVCNANINSFSKHSQEKLFSLQRIAQFCDGNFSILKLLVLEVQCETVTLFLPVTSTLFDLDSVHISESIQKMYALANMPDMLVVNLPSLTLYSTDEMQNLSTIIDDVPINIIEGVDPKQDLFSWTLLLAKFSVYTLNTARKFENCINPISLSTIIAANSELLPCGKISKINLHLNAINNSFTIQLSNKQAMLIAIVAQILLDGISKVIVQTKSSSDLFAMLMENSNLDLFSSTISKVKIKSVTSLNKEMDSNIWAEVPSVSFNGHWTMSKLTLELMCDDCCFNLKFDKFDLLFHKQDVSSTINFTLMAFNWNQLETQGLFNECKVGPFNGIIFTSSIKLCQPIIVLNPENETFETLPDDVFPISSKLNLPDQFLSVKLSRTLRDDCTCSLETEVNLENDQYINQISVIINSFDCVLWNPVFTSFVSIFEPFFSLKFTLPMCSAQFQSRRHTKTKTKVERYKLKWFNNNNLPLLTLNLNAIRILIPEIMSLQENEKKKENTLVLQMKQLSIVSQVDNPISRITLRPDIFELAQQTEIIYSPGSAVEDRQYQLDAIGISVCTGSLKKFIAPVLHRDVLNNEYQLEESPGMFCLPLLFNSNVKIIIAPAIVFEQLKEDVLVAGHSLEINIINDLNIYLSSSQLALIYQLCKENIATFMEIVNSIKLTRKTKSGTSVDNIGVISPSEPQSEIKSQLYYSRSESGQSFSNNCTAALLPILPSEVTVEQKVIVAFVPMEVLITGQIITVMLYIDKIKQSDSVMKKEEKLIHLMIPVMYIRLSQPHVFLQSGVIKSKLTASFYDCLVKGCIMNTTEKTRIPRFDDYTANLFETKPGNFDARTGISPPLLAVSVNNALSKSSSIQVIISRPWKIKASLLVYQQIVDYIQAAMDTDFTSSLQLKVEKPKFAFDNIDTFFNLIPQKIIKILRHFATYTQQIHYETVQVVIILETVPHRENAYIRLAWDAISGIISLIDGKNFQIEEIAARLCADNFSTKLAYDNKVYSFLNCCCANIKCHFVWDWWNETTILPRTSFNLKSEALIIHFGRYSWLCLKTLFAHIQEFLKSSNIKKSILHSTGKANNIGEVHEKMSYDDLRNGSFRYVENSNGLDLQPASNEIIFSNQKKRNSASITWRYPEPRVLTKAEIYAVPFQTSFKINCALQYWNMLTDSYIICCQFQLVDNQQCKLNIPQNLSVGSEVKQTLSHLWRIIINYVDPDTEYQSSILKKVVVSPQTLAACTRIDSYFCPTLITKVEARLAIEVIQFNITNHLLNSSDTPINLSPFAFDDTMPLDQDFLTTTIQDNILTFSKWEKWLKVDYESTVHCDVLEYRSLTMRTLLEPCALKAQLVFMPQQTETVINFNIRADSAVIYFGQSTLHTLLLAHRIFNQSDNAREEVLLTHYVICNDTQETIQFGQVNTNEIVVLPSRKMHAYCWRSHKSDQLLQLRIEKMKFDWCEGFTIDKIGVLTKILEQNEMKVILIIKIKMISNLQKQITIGGQIIFANRMDLNLIIKFNSDVNHSNDINVHEQNEFALDKQSSSASCLHEPCSRNSFKIRLPGENWSEHVFYPQKSAITDHILVKIPKKLDKYLNILCHFFHEPVGSTYRILVLFVPLYVIQSHVPCQVNILLNTTGKMKEQSFQIDGYGNEFQLYCSGSSDDNHQLKFNFRTVEETLSISTKTINQVTKLKHFKKIDIDEMIQNWMSDNSLLWPYDDQNIKIRKLQEFPACVTEILKLKRTNEAKDISKSKNVFPKIELEISMEQRWSNCNTLLIHIKPWGLIINKSTIDLLVIIDNIVWNVEKEQVCACSKIKDHIKFGLIHENETYYSEPYQVIPDDWSIRHYWPHATSSLPFKGSTRCDIKIKNGNLSMLCCLTLTTAITQEIHLFQIMPAYNIVNNTQQLFKVATFTTEAKNLKFNFHRHTLVNTQMELTFGIEHNGLQPLLFWQTFQLEDINSRAEEYIKCISFCNSDESNNMCNWSLPCQINTNQSYARHCISVLISIENASVHWGLPLITKPFLLTFHELDKISYFIINEDRTPQLLIHNNCSISLYLQEVGGDTKLLNCLPIATAMTACHYTLGEVCKRFPEIYDHDAMPKMCLANASFNEDLQERPLTWSRGIDVTLDGDLFLNIPNFGDVKIHLERVAHTMYIFVDPVCKIERSMKTNETKMESVEPLKIALSENKIIKEKNDSLVTALLDSSTKPSSSRLNKHNFFHINILFKQSCIVFLNDSICGKVSEILRFTVDNCVVIHRPSIDIYTHSKKIKSIKNEAIIHFGNIQIDNQLYSQKKYDYPVILIPQYHWNELFEENISFESILIEMKENAFYTMKFTYENDPITEAICFKNLYFAMKPVAVYLEDLFFSKVYDIISNFFVSTAIDKKINFAPEKGKLPLRTIMMNYVYTFPVQCEAIVIEPIDARVSLRTSLRMDISVIEVPLSYTKFERYRLLTTIDKAVFAISMHYVTDSLFKAGWVVGSLDVFGNPGGFARAVGSGFADFVRMPYQGLFNGPRDFLSGIADGTSSLFRQLSAGYLFSVTSWARSVSRNMGRISLDEDYHLQNEESHRYIPDNLTEGLTQGLSGFGISLVAAISGIIDQPIQSVQRAVDQRTPTAALTGLISGVGKGLVGIVAKPIAGAAELIAQAGHGILQGKGWSKNLACRFDAIPDFNQISVNSCIKYEWKMMCSDPNSNVICLIEASQINQCGHNVPCTLLLTSQLIFVTNIEHDVHQLVLGLIEIECQGPSSDQSLLCILPIKKQFGSQRGYNSTFKGRSDYFASSLMFYVCPQLRNIFVALFKTAKQNLLRSGF